MADKQSMAMSRRYLLSQSFRLAFVIGSLLALFISLTPFWQMHHGLWQTINHLLVITSLILAAFVGYSVRANKASFKFMLLCIAVLFSVILLLYLGGYVLTTAFFADQMVWIPFFHRDYTYHGSQSVSAYLNHRNNFRELLGLQIFSLMINSLTYFTAGSLGYGAKAMLEKFRNSSQTASAA